MKCAEQIVAVRHAINGCLRLRVPLIGRSQQAHEGLATLLAAIDGVRHTRINAPC